MLGGVDCNRKNGFLHMLIGDDPVRIKHKSFRNIQRQHVTSLNKKLLQRFCSPILSGEFSIRVSGQLHNQ